MIKKAYSLSNTLGVIKDNMTDERPQLIRKCTRRKQHVAGRNLIYKIAL